MNITYIRYSTGRVREGVILYLTDRMARVAIKDSADVAEFRSRGGQWLSEDYEVVVFECPNAPVLQALLWSEDAGFEPVMEQVN